MGWREKMAKAQAKREMIKLYKKYNPELGEIKDKIADLIDNVKEEKQMHVIIILCSEIIAGFEETEHQEFILQGVTKTLELLNKSE